MERKIVKIKVKKWNELICGLNPQFCPCNEFNMSAAVLQSNWSNELRQSAAQLHLSGIRKTIKHTLVSSG